MKDIKRLLSDIRSSVEGIHQSTLGIANAVKGRASSVQESEDDEAPPLAFLLLQTLYYHGPMTATELHKAFLHAVEETDELREDEDSIADTITVQDVYAMLRIFLLASPDYIHKVRNKWSVEINNNTQDLMEEYEEVIFPEILALFKP
jgi:hypothetical protein